jgi:Zn-dependent metalloprotease
MLLLKHTVIIASLGVILNFSVMGHAQEKDPSVLKAVIALQQRQLGSDFHIEWNKDGSGIDRIEKERNWTKNSQKSASLLKLKKPEDIAINFLKENASLFQLPTDVGDLHVKGVQDMTVRGRGDYAVEIEQTVNGLPVINRGLAVFIDQIDGVYIVNNNYQPGINISTTPVLSADEVITIAKDDTLKNHMIMRGKSSGESFPITIEERKELFPEKPELILGIYIAEKKEPILAYSFTLKILGIRYILNYLIDANSGAIISVGDPSMHARATGQSKVFWPTPD